MFGQLKAVLYKQQVVNGINYDVIYKTDAGPMIKSRIWRHWSGKATVMSANKLNPKEERDLQRLLPPSPAD